MRLPWTRSEPLEERGRRRRLGILLFFSGLLAVFLLARAVPSDWEIGPFRIDANGIALDPEASLYFADDPGAPFWLLVPTFNLPPRFFAARPHPSSSVVALLPSSRPSSSPSSSSSPTPSSSPSSSPSATPS